MKKIRCNKCGCERSIMLRNPKVVFQSANYAHVYKSMCVPCLISLFRGYYLPCKDYEVFWETIKEKEE